jgi:hypothetical protein
VAPAVRGRMGTKAGSRDMSPHPGRAKDMVTYAKIIRWPDGRV